MFTKDYRALCNNLEHLRLTW